MVITISSFSAIVSDIQFFPTSLPEHPPKKTPKNITSLRVLQQTYVTDLLPSRRTSSMPWYWHHIFDSDVRISPISYITCHARQLMQMKESTVSSVYFIRQRKTANTYEKRREITIIWRRRTCMPVVWCGRRSVQSRSVPSTQVLILPIQQFFAQYIQSIFHLETDRGCYTPPALEFCRNESSFAANLVMISSISLDWDSAVTRECVQRHR